MIIVRWKLGCKIDYPTKWNGAMTERFGSGESERKAKWQHPHRVFEMGCARFDDNRAMNLRSIGISYGTRLGAIDIEFETHP